MFHSITQSAMLKPRLLRKALEVTQKLCLPGMHMDFRASPVQATAEGQAREAAKTRYTLHALQWLPVRVEACSSWPEQALVPVALMRRHCQQLTLCAGACILSLNVPPMCHNQSFIDSTMGRSGQLCDSCQWTSPASRHHVSCASVRHACERDREAHTLTRQPGMVVDGLI